MSPTVGMLFRPHDFLTFVSNLSFYLAAEPELDEVESKSLGFPVGNLLGIRLLFVHYPSFEVAREKWMKRAALVDPRRAILVFTDRGGVSDEDLKRFDNFPQPKILLVAKPRPDLRSAIRVIDGHDGTRVGDLFTHWQHLSAALTSKILKGLVDQLESSVSPV